jgi:hypothetical protein
MSSPDRIEELWKAYEAARDAYAAHAADDAAKSYTAAADALDAFYAAKAALETAEKEARGE